MKRFVKCVCVCICTYMWELYHESRAECVQQTSFLVEFCSCRVLWSLNCRCVALVLWWRSGGCSRLCWMTRGSCWLRTSVVVGDSVVSWCVSKGCAFHHSGKDFHSLLVEMHMVIHMMWSYIFVMNIRNKCTASGKFHIISMNRVECPHYYHTLMYQSYSCLWEMLSGSGCQLSHHRGHIALKGAQCSIWDDL